MHSVAPTTSWHCAEVPSVIVRSKSIRSTMSSLAHPRRRDSSASRPGAQLARTLLARTHRRAIDVAPRPTTKAAAAYGASASIWTCCAVASGPSPTRRASLPVAPPPDRAPTTWQPVSLRPGGGLLSRPRCFASSRSSPLRAKPSGTYLQTHLQTNRADRLLRQASCPPRTRTTRTTRRPCRRLPTSRRRAAPACG